MADITNRQWARDITESNLQSVAGALVGAIERMLTLIESAALERAAGVARAELERVRLDRHVGDLLCNKIRALKPPIMGIEPVEVVNQEADSLAYLHECAMFVEANTQLLGIALAFTEANPANTAGYKQELCTALRALEALRQTHERQLSSQKSRPQPYSNEAKSPTGTHDCGHCGHHRSYHTAGSGECSPGCACVRFEQRPIATE